MLKPEEARFVSFLKGSLPAVDTRWIAESAAPSFCHPNPLIRWFVWQRIRRALALTEGLPSKDVLDFGSGSGVLLPPLASRAETVYAVDLNVGLITKAVQAYRLENIQVIQNSAVAIPLPAESVDLIYALEVLEHISNLDRVVSELARVCRVGGYLVVSVPTENIFYKIGRLLSGFEGEYHRISYQKILKEVGQHFVWLGGSKLFAYLPLYILAVYRKESE